MNQGGKDPARLAARWRGALLRGFARAGVSEPPHVEYVFPYYGDTLADLSKEVLVNAYAEPKVYEGRAPEREFYEEYATALGTPDAQRLSLADLLRAIGRLLDTIDGGPHGVVVLRQFARQAFAYLHEPHIRKAVDAIVSTAIRGSPCVVVAHSLGTIVAFNVLQKKLPFRAPRYVTVGSPLWSRTIQMPLRLTRPSVRDWKNGRHERDVVALHPLQLPRFKVEPSIAIENHAVRDRGSSKPHGIVVHLSDKTVARWIHDAITSGPVASPMKRQRGE
jgi:hypothetical protein